jgi:hypothetical protein
MLRKWILAILIPSILTACAQVHPTQTPNPEQTNVTNLPLQQTAKEYPPPQAAEESYPSPDEQALQPSYPDPQVELLQTGTRYGIPEVDRVLDTLFLHPDQADSLVVYTKAPCTTFDGLGGPPKCTESQNEGTIVEGIPVLGSEGQFIPKGSRGLTDIIGQTDLLGVFKVVEDFKSEEYYPAGQYGIVLTQKVTSTIVVLRLTPDGIVRLDFPTQIPGKEQPDLEIYLEPSR